jgi:hypothetical protein
VDTILQESPAKLKTTHSQVEIEAVRNSVRKRGKDGCLLKHMKRSASARVVSNPLR